MYGPPALGSNDLDTLIHWLGGDNLACKLLDITPRTLRRWRAQDYPVPQMALKLLWYAGPLGRQAADADLYNEVRLLRSLTGLQDRESAAGGQIAAPIANVATLKAQLGHVVPEPATDEVVAAGTVP